MRIHRIFGLMAYGYLIETSAALFLIDGGVPGIARRILKRIADIGRKPEELLFALITHGHADHFGGLAEVQEASGCAIIATPRTRTPSGPAACLSRRA
jgi:glyoxylase-like metal-dependent hydrolase (beta-lactamase superfamily II)